MSRDGTKTCVMCGESFSQEEIDEWRESGELFSSNPLFVCPDCLDRFTRQDVEDQFLGLMGEQLWR